MKKAILVVCLTFLLTSCGWTNNDSYTQLPASEGTTPPMTSNTQPSVTTNTEVTFPFDENSDSSTEIPKVSNKLTDEAISKLSSKTCGFGQGLRLDNLNRPYGALDFNSAFGKYDSYAIKETSEKVIYLTFDQGYENGYTTKILDVLKAKNVKATFFVLTDYAKRNSELVKRMIDEGHTVGNHSVHHYSMPTLDINTAKEEINGLHKYMEEQYKYEMFLFRPPMGEYSEKSLAITQQCGYKTVLWSYAYADWDTKKQMEPAVALEKLKKSAHPGCIYLLHSVSSTNAAILGDFIDYLKTQGYQFSIPQ